MSRIQRLNKRIQGLENDVRKLERERDSLRLALSDADSYANGLKAENVMLADQMAELDELTGGREEKRTEYIRYENFDLEGAQQRFMADLTHQRLVVQQERYLREETGRHFRGMTIHGTFLDELAKTSTKGLTNVKKRDTIDLDNRVTFKEWSKRYD
jgi:chromosome segregation ATPase